MAVRHEFWGFTPALDVRAVFENVVRRGAAADKVSESKSDGDRPFSALLVQPGDVRSVLKTIAQRRESQQPSREIHLYVFDSLVECLARHLLLLAIAFDWELPVRTRGNLWLEVWGNALVQDRTAKYIGLKAAELIDVVCNRRGPLSRIIDLSALRHRDRDSLEDVFKSWDARVVCDIALLRETRLRHLFGTRYDFRNNVIDWDFHETPHAVAGNIHSIHYRTWRNTGVAFEFGDQVYSAPNRSLASFAEGRERGVTTSRKGFWADIAVGPYYALGTSCRLNGDSDRARELFTIHSKGTGSEQWRHTAVEMSAYNILSFFHEFEAGERYAMKVDHDVYSGLGDADLREPISVTAHSGGGGSGGGSGGGGGSEGDHVHAGAPTAMSTADVHKAALAEQRRRDARSRLESLAARGARAIAESLTGVKIVLLSGRANDLFDKAKYRGLFDLVLLSSASVHNLATPGFASVLRDTAAVVCDTARNLDVLTRPQKAEFERRVISMARRLGLDFVGCERSVSGDAHSVGSVIRVGAKAAETAPRNEAADGSAYDDNLSEIPPAELLIFTFDAATASERAAAVLAAEAAAPAASTEGGVESSAEDADRAADDEAPVSVGCR